MSRAARAPKICTHFEVCPMNSCSSTARSAAAIARRILLRRLLWLVFSAGWLASAASGAERLADLTGVFEASFNHDGSRVLVRTREGAVGLWEVATGAPVAGDLGTRAEGGVWVWSADTRRVLVGFKAGGARVFAADTGAALSPVLEVPLRDKTRAAFSPDGAQVVMLDDSAAVVVEVESGRRLARIPLALPAADDEPPATPAVRFTADGAQCLLMDRASVVARYDARTWKPAGPALRHPAAPQAYNYGFALSADGRWVATFDGPGENGPKGHLQIWNAKGQALGKPLSAVNGMEGRFLAGADRLLILPGRGEGRVRALPSAKGYAIRPHDDIEGPSVAASRDGKWLLSWGSDRSLRLLDAATGAVKGSHSSGTEIAQVVTDAAGCYVLFDNTAFLLQNHHDFYVVRMEFPDLRITHSRRFTEAVQRMELSPDGGRLLIQLGPSDRERLLFLNAPDLTPLP